MIDICQKVMFPNCLFSRRCWMEQAVGQEQVGEVGSRRQGSIRTWDGAIQALNLLLRFLQIVREKPTTNQFEISKKLTNQPINNYAHNVYTIINTTYLSNSQFDNIATLCIYCLFYSLFWLDLIDKTIIFSSIHPIMAVQKCSSASTVSL